MGVQRPNSTSYVHPDEPNLLNLHKAMEYDVDGIPHVRVTLGSDNITVSGNVNVLDAVRVNNTEAQMIPVYLVGNVLTVNQGTNPWVTTGNANVTVVGNIGGITTLPAITGNVAVNNFPSNVSITSMPAITGNVNTTITDVITVVVNDDAGEIFGLNNHDTNVHRGWMMDDVMRPVISIRLNPDTTTSATLMKIIEYEIGNNNANQSTIMYEWYEGDLTIAGAAIPAWSTVHDTAATQYRVYQDRYSSNQGNTFTHPSAVMRHSGIIIGKNTEGDGIATPLTGGATGKTWTLCMKRLDNGTELDVWFAFTFKELT